MRVSIQRLVWGAFAALFLVVAGTTSAQAQSEQTTGTTRVNFDAASPASTSLSASLFAPKVKASFQPPQQPQLGPDAGHNDSGVGIGVLIMATRATFTQDIVNGLDSDARSGLGFGLWVGGNRNGVVGFVGEFIFLSRKGSVTDDAGNVSTATLKVLEIPVVFHVNFGARSRNSVGGYAVLGPAVSFNLGQSFTGGITGDQFGGVDVGFVVGAGIEVVRFGAEVRYNLGVKDISKEGTIGDIHSRTWEFLGKFAFN